MARLSRPTDEVADVLLRWLLSRRWYRGAAHTVQSARIVDTVVLPSSPPAVLALLQVQYRHTEPATYVVPLTTDEEFDADALVAEQPTAAIARLVGEGTTARLLDGSLVPGVFETLLGIASERRTTHGTKRDLVGHRRKGLRAWAGAGKELRATPIAHQPSMSNSSASFEDRLMLKLYRVLEDGPNPDLEVATHLAEAGFRNVPRVLGSVVADGSGTDATLAMVQAYVPHQGNLWETVRDAVVAFLQDAEAESDPPALEGNGDSFFLDLSLRPAPAAAQRLIGASLETARILGERVGEMHRILAAADPGDVDFAPELMTPFHVRSLYQSVRGRVNSALELLEQRRDVLPPRDQLAADVVLRAAPRVDALLTRLRALPPQGTRIRVHGDLHLGQVLDTGNDVVIIDFEGDTGRPLSERRLKRPALTDLASLVRSFHFAAHWPRVERELLSDGAIESDELADWAGYWFQWTAAACISGYRSATEGCDFNPQDDTAWSVLFKSLLVSRACDELTSRLGTRSDWLGIPLAGLDELLGGIDEPTA
jgi:maltose alpha-D-glucosyltransferase/alpha-amylase